jgi:O-antigen/teichoic acid export membrane protein
MEPLILPADPEPALAPIPVTPLAPMADEALVPGADEAIPSAEDEEPSKLATETSRGWRRTLAGHARTWTGILSAYFSAQTATQLAGMIAGLLLTRFMPVREFALYTLASSVISFFIFASDLGSTSSLVFFFHRTAREGDDFEAYLAAVLSLRRTAFLFGAAAVVLVFPITAAAKGFGRWDIALATAGILGAAWFQIAASVRVLALRLADRYGQSYRAEMAGGGFRLAGSLAMIAAALLRAWIAIATAALAAAVVARIARPRQPRPAATDLAPQRRQVLRYLLPSLPSALYFSIQGPLVVWLSATFGSTRNLAEVGALGRLGLLVGMFSGLTGVVFLPRMARITDDQLFRQRYLQFGASLVAIAGGMLATAVLAPGLLLFILGPHYAGLHRELLLVVAGSGLTLLSGYAVGVNLSRSWNRWESVAVLVLIAAQACFVAVLPLGTTAGVLWFNVLSAVVGLSLQLVITATGFIRPQWVRWMT